MMSCLLSAVPSHPKDRNSFLILCSKLFPTFGSCPLPDQMWPSRGPGGHFTLSGSCRDLGVIECAVGAGWFQLTR